MVILSLFDRTGIMVQPWADAGYECWAVDLQHEGDVVENGVRYIEADLRTWIPPYGVDYGMVFAFPPCTHLASSGARWFKQKGLPAFSDAILLVERAAVLCEAIGAPYMIENPVGMLSSYWREPDHSFHPFEYGGYLEHSGDLYKKRTNLWTGNGFKMPAPLDDVPLHGSKMAKVPEIKGRANIRSATPAGFAKAVFELNHDD